MSDNAMSEDTKLKEGALVPNRPYTIHLCFPREEGDCEYLLRYTKWREGEKTESGYVVEPIGEQRNNGHKRLVEYCINYEHRGRGSWGICTDKLHKMAALVTEALGGHIVAINEPDRPALPNPDLTPY